MSEMRVVRWQNVVPEKYRQAFLEHVKDPHLYSLRSDIALMAVYVTRLLQEMGSTAPARVDQNSAGAAPDSSPVEDRLVFTEEQGWARIMEAFELRMKMIGQEVKTMETLATHSARQWERAQALNAIVIETLRQHLAATEEGKRVLVAIADDLEARVREMQVQESKLLGEGTE